MADKDAKVTIGIDGTDEVARAADRALRPWTTAANAAQSAMQGVGRAFADTVRQTASDVARGVTAFAAFDLSSRIPAVIQYREEVARLSVVAGQSSDDLRRKFAAQEAATLQSRQANEEFAKSFGRITHNYKQGADAAAALADEALAANRSLGEMAGVGKVIYDATGKIAAAPEVLGRLRAQAEKLGTIGGPDALRDQFEALGATINRLAQTSPEQVGKLTGTLAAIGKGLRPEQAQEAQREILGKILGDTRATERFLRSGGELKRGESILDSHGQVKDVADVVARYQRAWRRGAGSEAEARRLSRMYFGDIGGASFMNANFGEAMGVGVSGGAGAAANSFRGSEEGLRLRAQLAARGAQMDIAGKALPAVDAVLGFAGEHPIMAGAGALMAPGLAGKGIGALMDGLQGALSAGGAEIARGGANAGAAMAAGGRAAGGGLSAAGTGLTGLLGKLGLVGAAGAAGYAVGTAIDQATGASDYLSGGDEEGRQVDNIASLPRNVTHADEERKKRFKARGEKMEAAVEAFQKTGYDKARFRRLYHKSMMEDAGGDAGQQRLIGALETGTLNTQGMQQGTIDMITKALEKANLHVAVVNKADGPIEALNQQNTDAAGAQ